MRTQRAEVILDRLAVGSADKLEPKDRRLGEGVLMLVDGNQDGLVDRLELRDGLVQGKIRASGKVLVPARSLSLAPSPNVPGTTPQEVGLAGPHWTKKSVLPGGNPQEPPLSTRVQGVGGTENGPKSQLDKNGVLALHTQDFETVSGALTTPEDVAFFLGTFEYDDARADAGKGPYAPYSSDETLALDTGVCRDQHTLARDILLANGYEAVAYGYEASRQAHAVTLYRDPKSGYWGMIEYGKIFPPNELKANSPEEALLMVRPTALVLSRYDSPGPGKRSTVDRVVYTETARVYERFMAGPSRDAGNSGSFSSQAYVLNQASPDEKWQGQFQIRFDPKLPYMKHATMAGVWRNLDGFRVGAGAGFIPFNTTHSVGSNTPTTRPMAFAFAAGEEHHPELLKADNIFGTGVHARVSSHSTAQGFVALDKGDEGDPVFDLESMTLSNLRTNPELEFSRLVGKTEVTAGYGVGLNTFLLASHYANGGRRFPIDQYATVGTRTQLTPGLEVSTQGYVPITNHTNDFSDEPLLRVALKTPYVEAGTTQGLKWASYDAAVGIPGVKLGKHDPIDVSAFGLIDHDRQSKQANGYVGIQLTASR